MDDGWMMGGAEVSDVLGVEFIGLVALETALGMVKGLVGVDDVDDVLCVVKVALEVIVKVEGKVDAIASGGFHAGMQGIG